MGRALLAIALVAGCVRTGAYHCYTSDQCVFDGVQGVCEGIGFCSFPDGTCPGGYRYGAHAGEYADECVTGDNSGYYSIGGRVNGLEGGGLVLRNNGIDDLRVSTSGPFTFSMELMGGEPYEVTVAAQPSNPQQTCVVNNSSGVTELADVTDIDVTCATRTFAIGGSVYGLVGTGLVLTNNDGDDLSITADGPFTFATQIPSAAPYSVAIKSQPSGQTCTVSGATGMMGTANVSTVVINCDGNKYTVGGTVAGIEGTFVIKNNNTDVANVTANGTFAFPTPLASNANYNVTPFIQPLYPPRNQTCTIAGASGNMPAANVTSVAINCMTNSFTIGGSLIGLNGVIVLQNNGSDQLTLTSSGNFTFAQSVISGGTYAVTIAAVPENQTCAISGSPSGVVANGNVTSIVITCGDKTDPGILCGSVYCDPAIELCCIDNGNPVCATSCSGSGTVPIRCDDQADCSAQGQPASICCGLISGFDLANVYCTTPDHCDPPKAYYCDPNLVTPCPDGGTCMPTTVPFPGWYRCY